ncbi:diguanylate cyclase [Lysobacter sp. TY2-98]|uniref:GGDEF domain-containing protein n=1 Tax=Lysobacter sp. TY2-98 TaxID=2290922 RepID=UPI000E203081|nr:GGDEF domain-containing protein [Lysobacter sp. TY2-98]AXK73026.1 diguanylate cyclase [Lysobacter sp. TY2-98]
MRRPLLPALLAAAMLAVATGAHAAPSALEFDRLFRQIDDGEVPVDDDRQIARALADLRAALPPGDAHSALRYRSAVCDLAFVKDTKAELAYARAARADAERAHDLDARARFTYCEGFALETADPIGARRAYDRGIALSTQAEDPRLLGDGFTYRGGIASLQGDHARALQDFLAAQAVFDRAKLARRSETNLLNIGMVYRRMGLYPQAMTYLRETEAYARRIDSVPDLYAALMQQGYAFDEQERGAEALARFREALAVAQRSDAIDRGYAHLGLANAWLVAGNPTRALGAVGLARRELAVDDIATHEPMLDQAEGRALAALGRHRAAIAAFDHAEPLMRAQDSTRYLALLHRARAASEEAVGDPVAALADLRALDALDKRLQAAADDQSVELGRLQFDAYRRAREHARLDLGRRAREQQIRALERERPWRWTVLGLGLALAGALAAFALLQARESKRLRVLALTDPLTGIANRRGLRRLAEDAFASAQADGRPISVVLLDLDHFKRVNDQHGHAIGDAVLIRASRALAEVLRPQDRLGRTGGEEFVVILPGTRRDDAARMAERLRGAVAELDIDSVPGLIVRTSAGVATSAPTDDRIDDLLGRADAALYRAKTAGRDRVISAD